MASGYQRLQNDAAKNQPACAQRDGPSTIDLTHDAEYGAPRYVCPFVCFLGEADMDRGVASSASVVNDSQRTSPLLSGT
jgi:hypothetical protein